jgi:hypothetical protein
MSRAFRFRGVASVALLAAWVGTATAQPLERGRRGGFDSVVTLAGNFDVQTDLGIEGELALRLRALREDMLAAREKEQQLAGIGKMASDDASDEARERMPEIGTKLNEEFGPKLTALVSADQLTRLNQIRLQYALANLRPKTITAPDVAAELSLSDDQKQKLNALHEELAKRESEISKSTWGMDALASHKLIKEALDPVVAKQLEAELKLLEDGAMKMMALLSTEQQEQLAALKGEPFDVSKLRGGAKGFGERGRRWAGFDFGDPKTWRKR